MKRLTTVIAAMLIVFVVQGERGLAQGVEQPLLIVSFNRVPMGDIGTLNKMVDSVFAPILKEMVNEKFIGGWGQFSHAWGDEWNFNIWYIAKNMSAFEKFWTEYMNRANKRHPGAVAAVTKHFQAHKDNIYTIRTQYPVPPQQ